MNLLDVIRAANADAYLIVHPDDEDQMRAVLARIPADLRPQLTASDTVPKPGTAYYSRPILLAEAVDTWIDDDVDDLELDRTPVRLRDGTLIAGDAAAAYRRVQSRIQARLAALDLPTLERLAQQPPPVDLVDFLQEE